MARACGILVFVLLCLASALRVDSHIADPRADFNRIEGTVSDQYKRPVADIYIELTNAVEGDLSRARTSGAGRFTFTGLSTGRFKVKVITSGTNYLAEEQDVEILGSGSPNSRETRYVDFYLKADPRKVSLGSGGPAEAIFIQDVADEARKLFKKGLPDIKTDKGMELVERAIGLASNYFDALSSAGIEYVERGNYIKGAGYLVRAVQVNPRSHNSYNSLAFAAYKLNKIPEALKAAQAAVELQPNAINSRILFARLLRMNSSFKAAEELLLDTKKLAPKVPMVYIEMALLYNRMGKNREAADELAEYLKLFPGDENKKEVEDLISKLNEAKK